MLERTKIKPLLNLLMEALQMHLRMRILEKSLKRGDGNGSTRVSHMIRKRGSRRSKGKWLSYPNKMRFIFSSTQSFVNHVFDATGLPRDAAILNTANIPNKVLKRGRAATPTYVYFTFKSIGILSQHPDNTFSSQKLYSPLMSQSAADEGSRTRIKGFRISSLVAETNNNIAHVLF